MRLKNKTNFFELIQTSCWFYFVFDRKGISFASKFRLHTSVEIIQFTKLLYNIINLINSIIVSKATISVRNLDKFL